MPIGVYGSPPLTVLAHKTIATAEESRASNPNVTGQQTPSPPEAFKQYMDDLNAASNPKIGR